MEKVFVTRKDESIFTPLSTRQNICKIKNSFLPKYLSQILQSKRDLDRCMKNSRSHAGGEAGELVVGRSKASTQPFRWAEPLVEETRC